MNLESLKAAAPRAKRMRPDLIISILGFSLMFFIVPLLGEMQGMLSIMTLKAILISCGIMHAHITRKAMLPYVDLSSGEWTPGAIAVIVLYAVIPICWARGG